MKEKFLENLNAMVYAFVGFVTLFLLGCPSLISNNVAGLSTFVDSFGLFNYASYCVGVNLQWSTSIFSNIGALAAAGVFNIFVLISALLLFAIGVLTLLKKAKIFDWKLDEKIGNFELISKILISVYTGFAFLSFLCVGVFVGANSRSLDFAIGGGLTAMFIFGAIGCIVVWLLPVILKSTGKNKSKKTVTGDSVEFESEASLEPSQANVNKDAKKVSAKKVVTADADVEKENEEEIVLEAEVDEVKSAPVKKAAAKESVAVKEVEKATDEDVEKPVKKAIEKKSATKSEADVEKAEK